MKYVEERCEDISLINHSRVRLQGKVNHVRQQFKKHLYRVVVAEDMISSVNDIYDIVESKPLTTGYQSIIKSKPGIGNNNIIRNISDNYTIECFEELLPSMQEVFIEVVKK